MTNEPTIERTRPIMDEPGSPVSFEASRLANDTSTWSRIERTSVFSARVHVRSLTSIDATPDATPTLDLASSTHLFAGYQQANRLDAWFDLFSNQEHVTRGLDHQGRATTTHRVTHVEWVLTRTHRDGVPETTTRWVQVNLTPNRILGLVERAWRNAPPDITTPREPRLVQPDRTSLHQALSRHGMDAVLDDITCSTVIQDLCLDPYADPHLSRWDRSRGRVPTYT